MGCALSMQLPVQVHNLEPESSEDYRRAWQHGLCTEPCGADSQRDICDKPNCGCNVQFEH